MEAVGQPRGGIDIEIPADGIGAVGLQRIKGVNGVALGFTHLLAVFILHVPQHNDVLKAGTVKHQGGNGVQRIEPAAGLVHRLADEVGGELCLEQLLILKGIMVLRKGHRAGIEPAVDDLGDTVHLFAALGAADGHGVDEGTVQLNVLGAVVAHLPQLLDGTDGMALAAFTLPDVKGGAPVAVAAQAPVLNILQPVPEAALADAFGDPVDGIVIADEVILHRRHLDEPALAGIVQQGGIAAPAEGIVMLKLRRIVQKPPAFQVHQHLGVGVLHKQPRKGGLLGHMALAVHELHKGQVIAAAHLCVVLTKGGRNMHDAGTVTHGNIVGHRHIKALFLLLFGALGSAGEKRLIFLIFQCSAGHLLQHLIGGGVLGFQPSQHGIQKRLRQIVGIAVGGLHLAVGILGVDAQRHVAGQRPGGGRPRQEVGVLALHLKAHDSTALLDGLIALRHLMAGKRGAAAGAVRHDLKALIQKPAVVNALERPPFTFDIIVIVGDIGVVHIRPKTHRPGEILPHALILPHAFLAVRNKGLQPVLLYLVLAVQTQLLFHLQLYRQSVGIPAGDAQHRLALHGLIAGNQILDGAGKHMADMGLAVGGGRAVEKGEIIRAVAQVEALVDNIVVLPELEHFLFALVKMHVGCDFAVHLLAPFSRLYPKDRKSLSIPWDGQAAVPPKLTHTVRPLFARNGGMPRGISPSSGMIWRRPPLPGLHPPRLAESACPHPFPSSHNT